MRTRTALLAALFFWEQSESSVMIPATPAIFDVRLFPLPGVVLFPGAVLPLRVFEPRYLKLLEDSLASDRRIGMAHLKPDPNTFLQDQVTGGNSAQPGVHSVLGVGVVVAQEQLPDGTWHIALLGESRCRVRAEVPHEPYRIASVEVLTDTLPASSPDQSALRKDLRALRGIGRELVMRTVEGAPRLIMAKLLGENNKGGEIADMLASMYVRDAALSQKLLESTELLARVRLLKPVLERLLARAARAAPAVPFDSDDVCLN